MTIPPNGSRPPAPLLAGPRPTPRRAPRIRTVDVAAVRPDGSLAIGQRKVPALPLFDSAFSALARGTPLQTPQGPVAIEDLRPGNLVLTVDGPPCQIVWIGSATFSRADVRDGRLLTRVVPDSFGVERPGRLLTLGPAARVLQTPPDRRAVPGQRRIMTPASAFVDGVNAINVLPQMPVQMFHLCLAEHAAVIAGGLEVESFHPGSDLERHLSDTLKPVLLSVFPQLTDLRDFGPLRYERTAEAANMDAA
ncbi:Hint domain-containing protein [Roseobacter sinensis]|uniref:Hint domain-containing protein n=1 Tax=Roseobacter sinensis TaxID=2931391 RepID=A0ABT3BAK2_9RHOB|nr:Hint domain-containing protein [Roseobacter sp. WL0113]MCV3270585.1 Hint domain-containing protein [Roseobacter sp. WL0113]